jgi:heavy metal sensor kinase
MSERRSGRSLAAGTGTRLRGTLRARLALQAATLSLVVLVAFGIAVYVAMAKGLRDSTDKALRLAAAQIMAGINNENGRISLSTDFAEVVREAGAAAQGLTVQVLGTKGTVLFQYGLIGALGAPRGVASSHVSPVGLANARDPGTGTTLRIVTRPVIQDNGVAGYLRVGESTAAESRALHTLALLLFVSVPVVVVLAALGGYVLAARALAPIERIRTTAAGISTEDLSARIALSKATDEVGRLAATFNSMLDRLERSFLRERRFVADASHELRTPLAAQQAIIDVMQQRGRTVSEYRRAIDDLQVEIQRMSELANGLLELERDGIAAGVGAERIDLSALLVDVCDSFALQVEAKGLTLTREVPEGLEIAGDADRLIRLFANLLANAVKYTESGGIMVSARQSDGGGVTVSVSDTGPGISTDQLPHLFDRFYRAEEARSSSGAGLGLPIALASAQAHGGSIEVQSTEGQGAVFTVRLPGA